MLRVAHHVGGRADFDQLAVVQNGEPVGDLVGDAEVVGDQQHRAAELVAQLAQQVQQLRLHGHVECGGRFVGDDQTRTVRFPVASLAPPATAIAAITRCRSPPDSSCG